MGQEVELKLSFPEDQAEQLVNANFWTQHTNNRPDFFNLGNVYFDTPQRELDRANVALRIREKKGLFFQTVKTRGISTNGLSHRKEWEWPIAQAVLDLSLLENLELEELKGINLDTLTPLFSTNFERCCWLVHWESPKATVEAALDRGQIIAGDKSAAICELELELISGDENALTAIAQQLAPFADLTPADKSKAERGVELITVT